MNFRPVFIAGCDRSGTTLLGDLLGSSSWSVVTPESQFIHDLLIRFGLQSFCDEQAAANWLQAHFRYSAWNLALTTSQLASKIDIKQPRKTIENLVAAYVSQHHPAKLAADIWIDHTPDNFKYQAMLKSLYPEARFIHIVRDGRAVCASIKPLDWGPNNAYMASRHWATRLQEAMAVEFAEGDNCMRVRFEDLLHKPEKTIRDLCNFIHLPFDQELLNGGGLTLPDFTRKQHSRVGGAPEPSRASSWEKQLSKDEIRDFESYPLAHTLLHSLGYETQHPTPPQLSATRVLRCYCHEFISNINNRAQHRRMEQKTVAAYKKQRANPDANSVIVR